MTSVQRKTELATRPVAASHLSQADQRARMNVKRSTRYVELMSAALDAGTHVQNKEQVVDLLRAIAEEFPDLQMTQMLTGIVAKCYLGEPYEVHTLDIGLSILTHFKRGQSLPAHLEQARSLALHESYAFVEVYGNELRPVTRDGRVTTIAHSSES